VPLDWSIRLALPRLAPVICHRPIPHPVFPDDAPTLKPRLDRMTLWAKGLQPVDPECIGSDSAPGPDMVDHGRGPDQSSILTTCAQWKPRELRRSHAGPCCTLIVAQSLTRWGLFRWWCVALTHGRSGHAGMLASHHTASGPRDGGHQGKPLDCGCSGCSTIGASRQSLVRQRGVLA